MPAWFIAAVLIVALLLGWIARAHDDRRAERFTKRGQSPTKSDLPR